MLVVPLVICYICSSLIRVNEEAKHFFKLEKKKTTCVEEKTVRMENLCGGGGGEERIQEQLLNFQS